MVLAALLLTASPGLTRGLGLAVHDDRSGPCAPLSRGGRGCSVLSWLTPSPRPRLGAGEAEGGELCLRAVLRTDASAGVLHVSRSSLSARSGLTPAVAEGLEASLVTRASRMWAGWLVWARSGIPSRSAAPMAAWLPVAIPANRAGRRARTESAVRARRNMVAH